MNSATPRIVIRSTNWIGDAVMSLAAVREIRRQHPESRITLFGQNWVAGVFAGQNLVDDILTFSKGERALGQYKRLRGFDRAILLQNAFEAALMSFFARIPERIGYATQHRGFLLTRSARPRIKELGRHQVYYYLDLLFQTGLSEIDYLNTPDFRPDISIIPTPESVAQAGRLLEHEGIDKEKTLIGFNPGAYFGPAKRWTTDGYAALADRLIEELSAEIVIFGSKGEQRIADEIASKMRNGPKILSGKTDLGTLLGTMARCRVIISNDSGPMHLAAALGLPLVALFGSTDEVATGPFSATATVIHKHVECSPCLRRECPIDLRCFTSISVDEVFNAAVARLEGPPPAKAEVSR